MGVEKRPMTTPDETKTFDKGQVEVVKLGGVTINRNTFEPGWRWSTSVKPLAKTDSCQVHHMGYILSGTLHVASEDGDETEIGPGELEALLGQVQPLLAAEVETVLARNAHLASEVLRIHERIQRTPLEIDRLRVA